MTLTQIALMCGAVSQTILDILFWQPYEFSLLFDDINATWQVNDIYKIQRKHLRNHVILFSPSFVVVDLPHTVRSINGVVCRRVLQ